MPVAYRQGPGRGRAEEMFVPAPIRKWCVLTGRVELKAGKYVPLPPAKGDARQKWLDAQQEAAATAA